MLILTRRPGESVVIANETWCTVLGIKGNQVRLGFDAPAHVCINRDEIHRRMLQERGVSPSLLPDIDNALIDALVADIRKRELAHSH